ncbi:MAG: hypothetical protein HYZ11_16985 [Candidatus Tectomicrobia bacterium]|uniref:Cytochrome c-type biogenesis protein H Ig-like domain-containing protein n=1 Tax=Tectimicrobiota bacterium TaxID=2528274 RepID=A0A932I4T5_UNCTE|nr:hypothetical protein [Candidatus Tectomicrobia bacterium]
MSAPLARRALGWAFLAMLAAGCGSEPQASVSGVVHLAPSLPPEARKLRQLFIYLEPAQGGPPFAVQRLVEPSFPLRFVMTPDDVFAPGRAFSGQVRVRARLLGENLTDYELGPLRRANGAAPLARGSYEGVSARPAPIGARDVEVVIAQAGSAEPPKEAAKKPEAPARGQAPAAPPSPPQAQARPPAQTQPQAPKPPEAAAPAGGGAISGTVVLAPALAGKAGGKRALFLIARPEGGGPPLAVVRIPEPKFPLAFQISQEHVMMPGVKFEGRVRLVARVDADGSAGPPQKGDLEGQAPDPVAAGTSGVTIVVDKEY